MTHPDWFLGFESLETEHTEALALEVIGEIPEELFGTLYRNGPARHDVYGERLQHWFDGDGMVHAFSLDESGVQYRNRFVQSEGHREEDAKRRRVYGRFGTRPAGNFIQRFLHRAGGKNGQNTSVHLHGDALFAFSEGGKPMRLHPVTLASLGEDDLNGLIGDREGYSAHPRFDEQTGELWNFTTLFGKEPRTRVLCRDAAGHTVCVADFAMPLPSMVHDFALTRTHAIIKYDPYVLPRVPVGLILGQKSYGQSLSWKPELGGTIALVPRDGGSPRIVTMEPRLAVHVIHAFDDEATGEVVLDILSYPDGSVMNVFGEAMRGRIDTDATTVPERVRIGRSGAARIERLSEGSIELPRHLAPIGAPLRAVWGVASQGPRSVISTPALIDVENVSTTLSPIAPGEYYGECVPVRKRGGDRDIDAWLLTVVLDTARRRSELRILDGADLSLPPVARAIVPHAIPFGFHGSFSTTREVDRAVTALEPH